MQDSKIVTGVPFKRKAKLTKAERDAVSHYRDAGTNQRNWTYFIPANRWEDRDCYMINELLRGNLLEDRIEGEDRQELFKLIPKIYSATTRERAPCKFRVYKGLRTDSWINEKFDANGRPLFNKTFRDFAFGSFTSKPQIAYQYTNQKDCYFLAQMLDRRDYCLYIDNKEYEWLLPPNIDYVFDRKIVEPSPYGGQQIVYYIRRANR